MSLTAFITRYRIWHLLFWTLLFGAWYFFRYDDFVNKSFLFRITLIKVLDLALMVYLTNYLLIPRLLYKKHYLGFGIAFLCFVFAGSWLKMYLEGQVMNNADVFDLSRNFKRRVYDNMIPHLLLVSTGAAFKLLLDYARAQRRIGEMAKENAEAELNFLRSQINPHVVFNSLNAIYFLIDKQNTAARNALDKFSGMLRYQLYECNGNTVPVEKELAYIEDYISVQQLRRDENCLVTIERKGQLSGFPIAPLLLVPFVENAFKHLSYHDNTPNTIHLLIERSAGLFRFTVTNTATTDPFPPVPGKVGGIGLKNVQRRLDLLYPGQHHLYTGRDGSTFTATLQLNIV